MYARLLLVALLTAQFLVVERAVVTGARFADAPGSKLFVAVLVGIVWLLGVASLTIWRGHHRVMRRTAIGALLLFSARFYSPAVFSAVLPPTEWPEESMAVNVAPELVHFLRELAAAQEQYRLQHRKYSSSVEDLRAWTRPPRGSSIQIAVRGDSGWSARVSAGRSLCTVWVRDSALRTSNAEVEGSPYCGGREIRGNHQHVHTVTVPPARESPFTGNLDGDWLQHRADARRSGIAAEEGDTRGFSWTRSIGGSIRASASIAGNQVFVGAHGNGELVALSLDSGNVGFRIRAPNWVHHEPAVTDDVIVVGFGNNEPSPLHASYTGSPPSGVAVYDRRTGRERWRRYTNGSVMTTPVVADSSVAVVTGGREAVVWRLADGARIWSARLADYSPMGNPLGFDTLLVVGLEPTTICAFGMRSGRRVFCRALGVQGWGAGHASPAVAGDVVLQVYEEDLDGTAGREDSRAMFYVRKVLGLPPRRHFARPPDALREQVLVAVRMRDGGELWRARLGPGRTRSSGHVAGTPTIADGVAYVPSPANRSVVAVDVGTGRVVWSAKANPSRGSVLVWNGSVIAATADTSLVVLDARTGALRCRQRLPQVADRAGPAVSGATGVLTLRNGLVMARPLADWIACRA